MTFEQKNINELVKANNDMEIAKINDDIMAWRDFEELAFKAYRNLLDFGYTDEQIKNILNENKATEQLKSEFDYPSLQEFELSC